MNTILDFISGGLRYIKSHPQLLFTLLLIIVIPVAFLISGQQFLKAAIDNQEGLEKERIGLMHDVFASYLRAVSFDPGLVQNEISDLAKLNPDITKFRVAKDTNFDVIPIAALDLEKIGVPEEDPGNYRLAQFRDGESIINPHIYNGSRFWQSFRLVRAEDGSEFYIFIETSLAGIDSLFAERIRNAYYWMFGLLAIVLLLVLRHVRLIDYGYLYKETKKANETKDLFTNMIAHELRAPLTAMRGYASMIRENENIEQPVRDQGSRIEQSAERLVVIVNDLLDVARIQSGKLSVTKEEVNMSDVVVSVTEALAASAQEKNIELTHEGTGGDILFTGDGKRLHQAVTNLVSNAIKYTPKGLIAVSVEDKKNRVELRVKDTGMGIEAQDQKELFAPFFRVKNEDVSSITGTGLGMWITKQLIELMGGSIGVESIKGVGTHVVVTFPKS